MEFSFASKQQLLEALHVLGVSAATVSILEEKIALQKLKSNTQLVRPGQINTHLYYVLSGGFVCRFISEDAEVERSINFYLNELHPIMACIDSYFAQTKTSCELRAIADSTVVVIPKKELDLLIEKDAQIKMIFDTLLVKVLMEENDLKLKIIAYKPDALYQYLIKTFPVIVQKVPSKYIAELMGISAEWLSKLKAKQKSAAGIS